MDGLNLPRHVVERVERRWAAVFSRQATLRPVSKLVGVKDPSPGYQETSAQSTPASR